MPHHYRLTALAALAASLAACGPPPIRPSSPAEAAAMAQCRAQGLAAIAGALDPVAATVGRMRYEAACMHAWQVAQPLELAIPNRGPATSDRPSYDW
jgi:hypothetical protein